MNRCDRTVSEPDVEAGCEMAPEERIRTLYAAAYPPAYPSGEPSDVLSQRVADLAALHDARPAQSQRGWLPLGWRYAAGATAAALMLTLALALIVRSYRP